MATNHITPKYKEENSARMKLPDIARNKENNRLPWPNAGILLNHLYSL